MNLIDYFANVMADYRTAQGVNGDEAGDAGDAGSAGREGSERDRGQPENVETELEDVTGNG